jgi:hypothetical protein
MISILEEIYLLFQYAMINTEGNTFVSSLGCTIVTLAVLVESIRLGYYVLL